MVSTRNKITVKKELVKYISSLGLKVNTVTKARGNKGFFKEGRIDISNRLDDSGCIKTLIHEYAHYVNYCLDNKIKDLSVLFDCDDELIRDELLKVTNFVDENSSFSILYDEKEKLKLSIKTLSCSIKEEYPNFKISEEFKAFRRYARWSDLRYLEKYDRVKVHSWFSYKVYSIATVKKDFPDIPEVFVDYLKLRSKQRKQAKISRKISRLKKYYSASSELFARFIEGLYIDYQVIRDIAPYTYSKFIELYNKDYYYELKNIFDIVGVILD